MWHRYGYHSKSKKGDEEPPKGKNVYFSYDARSTPSFVANFVERAVLERLYQGNSNHLSWSITN
ncbi:hypothetical protein M565_ctg1P0775 [Vibrio cyclitrophicus FF75]|nr:hypothetical protein M565_ctg1P0775 [Vibrio cyclitrophicus FF75]|tara:strand:- start:2342 stop:2533 length:192 start_codon:yes stop_codon:yes gene_type:complete